MQKEGRRLFVQGGTGAVRERRLFNTAHRVQQGSTAKGVRDAFAGEQQGGVVASYRQTKRAYLYLRVSGLVVSIISIFIYLYMCS